MTKNKKYAKELLAFLDAAPTPFQSTDELSKMLDKAGAVRLCEGDEWHLEKGTLYYMTKEGTQLSAFRISEEPKEVGFRIGAAHQDAPGFRIKTVPSKVDMGYERICVEGYGGLILHGWADRPLSVAGRIFVKDADGNAVAKNINIHKPILIMPSAAIHMVRGDEQGKFNIQTEFLPFFNQNADGEVRFTDYLASELGCKKEDILSFELAPYEYFPGCFVGENEEFISVPRLDDAAMSHAIISAICEKSESGCDIAMIYDHEEIGSNSDRGARSAVLKMLIDRICASLGYTAEDKYRALAKTVVFSADMAHATHPSFAQKSDPNLPVKLNGGPVLKLATRQSYATSSHGTAIFRLICEKEKIPYQVFNNRSDAGGGGTIGPMLSADLGAVTVDIGNPMLSMHAVRELGGTEDGYNMVRLYTAFFEGK